MRKSTRKNNEKKSLTSGTQSKKSAHSQNGNGIKKEYVKSGHLCKVTFRLPKDAAPEAHVVNLAGDFNSWDQELTRMKRLKNGDFTLTLELEQGKEFRFRYLIDNRKWENHWSADKYLPNPFGGDDSVVIT